jgi:hypothetical protein
MPGCFIAGEIASCTHWIRSGVDLTAGLDAVEKIKMSCPYQKSNPVCPT